MKPGRQLRYFVCASLCVLLTMFDATFSAAQTIYVATAGQPSGLSAYNVATGAPFTGFQSPSDVDSPTNMDVLDGSIYVTDYNGLIGKYDAATGAKDTAFVSPAGVDLPYGVTKVGNNLYVASFGNNTIGVYNATTGAAINPAFITGLAAPTDLVSLGNTLYVSNQGGALQAYDSRSGQLLPGFVSPPTGDFHLGISTTGNTLYVIGGIRTNTTIYAVNALTGTLDPNFTPVTGLAGPGTTAVLDNILYVSYGGANPFGLTNIAVVDATTGAILNPDAVGYVYRVAALGILPVPEPSTWALLGVGLAGLGLAMRRLSRAQLAA